MVCLSLPEKKVKLTGHFVLLGIFPKVNFLTLDTIRWVPCCFFPDLPKVPLFSKSSVGVVSKANPFINCVGENLATFDVPQLIFQLKNIKT